MCPANAHFSGVVAEELLTEPPESHLDDVDLRARRLKLLEAAGEDTDVLEPEWRRLLYDFPGDESLYLRRFDQLWERDNKEEAIAVLDQTHVLPSEHARESHHLYEQAHTLAALAALGRVPAEGGELFTQARRVVRLREPARAPAQHCASWQAASPRADRSPSSPAPSRSSGSPCELPPV